jgi:hypothetical protein
MVKLCVAADDCAVVFVPEPELPQALKIAAVKLKDTIRALMLSADSMGLMLTFALVLASDAIAYRCSLLVSKYA